MAHYLKNLSRARRRAARSIDIRRSVSGRRFSAEALERRRLLTAITWTGTFDHTNWNQPGNWSTNTVPTAADDVTINTANTIQSNSTQAVHNLTFNNGTIAGSGELDVGGAFHWVNGTLDTGGKTVVVNTGSLAFDPGNHELNRELDLNGPATWTSGNIGLSGGTIVNNSTFTATPGTGQTLQMFGNGGGVNAFNNQGGGAFIVSGPGTVRVFFLNNALPFNNTSSVEVQSGTLQISSGGTSSGSLIADAGATLAFPFDYTFAAGSSASGAGSFQFTGGTQTLTADQTFPNLTLNNPIGMEVGPGSLTVTGPFHWISGTLGSGTKTIVPATGSLTLDTGNHQLEGELDLNGPATWTAGNIALFGGTIVNNATFTAAAATSQTLQMFGNGGGANAFNNQGGGSFVANGPGTVRVFFLNNALPFNNAGSVSVQAGTLQISSGGMSTGGFTVAAGATLAFPFDYTFAAGSSASGAGSFQFTGGTQTLSADQTFPNLTLNNPIGMEVGPGSLTVGGPFQWISGTLVAKTIVPATGSLTLDTGNHELNGELDLNGPATWTAGNIGVGGGTIVNNATFTATAATSQTLQMFGNGAGVNAFNNQAGGSFIVNGPGTVRVFFLNSALPFNNAGSVSVQSGILHLESASSHSGDFDGQAGATLLFLGNQTFAASSHINGNLNLEIDSGTDTYPNGLNTTGTVTFRGGSFTIGGNVSGGTLAFTGGTGVLNGAVNSTNSLSITGGKFVLGGALTTHYGGAPFLTPTVRGYLLSSALAPAVIGGSLGYADGADGIVAGLNAGDFLIKPAVPGDADLNGKVGFPDLVLLARHYGQSNVGWDVGDFNYDGKVGFDDLVILARHYGKVGPTAAAASFQAGVIATTPLITLPSHRRRIPGSV